MILCPNCHHQELPGALFCSECGVQLVGNEPLTTQNLGRGTSDHLDSNIFNSVTPAQSETPVAEAFPKNAVVSLEILETDRTIHLSGRYEYTLGRIAEGQPILPDVDLSDFEAYAQGVSRLHASIKVSPQRIAIMDLGSSNGTRVNGQKIVPHVDYPVKNGDVIALGKMKIHLHIHR